MMRLSIHLLIKTKEREKREKKKKIHDAMPKYSFAQYMYLAVNRIIKNQYNYEFAQIRAREREKIKLKNNKKELELILVFFRVQIWINGNRKI